MAKITGIGHVALRCHDVAKTADYYINACGATQKFVLTYGDWLAYMQESNDNLPQEFVDKLTARKDENWITYVELGGGQFVELFNPEDATIDQLTNDETFNYNHVAIMVDDIHAFHEKLLAAGAPIDSAPSFGLDFTWQMWSHDPDGNRVEFMQYSDKSFQLVGKN